VAALVGCGLLALLGGSASADRAARASPASAVAGVEVLPFSGTPDVSPSSAIDFLGLSPAELGSIRVEGSRSGLHPGRLSALPDGRGTAFVPHRPFADDETVSVRAAARAHAPSEISSTFTVSAPLSAGSLRQAVPEFPARPQARAAQTQPVQTFNSTPGFKPPLMKWSGTDPDPQLGDIFTDVERSPQNGPMILDPYGGLVWFSPLGQGTAFDLQVQQWGGQSVLTYWQGKLVNGIGQGQDLILDHSYRLLKTVSAGNGYLADSHEFQITPRGTALITIYNPVRRDLTSVGGSRTGTVLDGIIQEVDIASGRVLWEWHALGHVPITDSYAGTPSKSPYDYIHINSVQSLPGGKLLVSARHTWAVYEIDKRTGKVIWTLGGKHSSFKMQHGTNFKWQHDARLQPNGTMTVFDDGAGYTTDARQSRGLRIRLNFKKMKAVQVHAYTAQPPQLALSRGSMQVLSDNDVFIGWGEAPAFSEFGRQGHQLFIGSFTAPFRAYRTYRFQWWGQPGVPPSIAVSPAAPGVSTVYASWNGATTVAYWKVLAGPTPTSLRPIAEFAKFSFETAMTVASPGPYFSVQALDQRMQALKASPVVTPSAARRP
jgi:Arylsulfotransferase (ASST)